MKNPQEAFELAISEGRLSADENAPNYAGHYMYMGPNAGGTMDAFKHRMTREYLANVLKRGVQGYWLFRVKATPEDATAYAARMNEGNCDAAQLEAMEVGSMFGFDVPGADPDQYRDGWSLIQAMFDRGDFAL